MNRMIYDLSRNMRIINLKLMKDVFNKWDGIYKRSRIDHGMLDCALCDEYFKWNCFRCPVRMTTGKMLCSGTPYEKWQKHQFTFHKKSDKNGIGFEILCSECKKIVYEEIEFLWNVYNNIHEGRMIYNE